MLKEQQVSSVGVRRRFIYRNGAWYDKLHPAAILRAEQSLAIVSKYGDGRTGSMLDVGCGTGHGLALFGEHGYKCWGLDGLQEMVDAANERYPQARTVLGDMRGFDLGVSFDVIIALGGVLSHALTNSDVRSTLRTFSRNMADGALLVLEGLNACAVLNQTAGPQFWSHEVIHEGVHYRGEAETNLDLANSLFKLTRTWTADGIVVDVEQSEHRLMLPLEMEAALADAGFEVIAQADNEELRPSDMRGSRYWVLAKKN